MIVPATVQIGPYTYTVALVERVRDDAWAYIEFGQRAITIQSGLPPCAIRAALMHEVTHGANNLAGMTDGKRSEEAFTTRQAPILLDVLRRNPQLVAFLTAEDE